MEVTKVWPLLQLVFGRAPSHPLSIYPLLLPYAGVEPLRGGVGGLHHSTDDSKTCSACTPFNEYYQRHLGHLSRAPYLRTVGLQPPSIPAEGWWGHLDGRASFILFPLWCKHTYMLVETMAYVNGLSQWVLGQLSHPDLEQLVADQRWKQHFPAASSLCLDGWC